MRGKNLAIRKRERERELFDVPTNNKRILDRAKRAPPSDNKIHHGGSSPEAYPVARRKRRKRDEGGGRRGEGGTKEGARACRTEYRAKRSAAIFLATYVTGVENEKRKDLRYREKKGGGKRGKKAGREFPSIASDDRA